MYPSAFPPEAISPNEEGDCADGIHLTARTSRSDIPQEKECDFRIDPKYLMSSYKLQPLPRVPSNLLKRFFQKLLYLRFLLFQRHRHNRLVIEWIADRPFVILLGVFNPTLFFSSKFFVQTFSTNLIPPGSVVLDMGTGSGVGAVFAAEFAARVVAVDVNPAAVRCARINMLLNGVEDRVEVREGDLFAPVYWERFDVVLFNPPYLTGTPTSELEKAFFSTGVAARFAEGLQEHLNPGGHALLILSDIGDGGLSEARFLQELRTNGFKLEVVAQRKTLNETFTIYRVS
jgi:HemK-related putative methylase